MLQAVLLVLALAPAAEPVLSDAEVGERLGMMAAELRAGTSAARWWWNGWFGAYGIGTIVQGAIAVETRDRNVCIANAVGAGATLIGALALFLGPFPARNAEAQLAALDESTPEARRLKLLEAERLLAESAEAEEELSAWYAHVIGFALAAAQGLILEYGYHLTFDAWLAVGLSVAVSEAQIWTQPTRAIDDWARYRTRSSIGAGADRTGWHFVVVPGGVGLATAW